ncbi:MAG: SDR family oxidoreductase [Lysobacteraceae bacterium]|nr:MAG: SDR family oxidoreductase [Xanthomonadaceae bacterium]
MALAGRTVILTGASGGIGAALCDALIAAQARVVAIGRDEARLAALARKYPEGQLLPLAADLGSDRDRDRVIAEAAALRPTPSVLILAHAQSAFGLFEEQSDAQLRALIETNLTAPLGLIHGMLPMLKRHEQAAVVAIGSTFGSLAFPGFAAYSATKFGLRGLIEGLAREYADTGLRFQFLSPRATRTGFNTSAVDALNRELKVAQDDPADVAAQLVEAIAQGRRRLQIGWPEKLFARVNGAWPGLVDRSLRPQLSLVRKHARS